MITVHFRELNFPENPHQYPLTQLPKVSHVKLTAKPDIGNPNLPKIRSTHQIIADLQNSKTEHITQLEWIYYLYSQSQQETHPELAAGIWKIAQINLWLKLHLFWKLALQFSRSKDANSCQTYTILPKSLIAGFTDLTNTISGSDRLPIQILNMIPKHEAETEIANLCWQKLYTPIELMEKAQLPTELPVIQRSFNLLITNLVTRKTAPSQSEIKWLLRCLQQMSSQQQLTAVEELLTQLSGELKEGLPKLIEWLKAEYQPRSHQLSHTAKTHLQQWVAKLNYSYFQHVTNLVIRNVSLPEADLQKIEERRDFWKNYSDRIQKIRILLPHSSLKKLSYQLPCEVDPLILEGNDETEVSIFDFDQQFLIEIWRGSGSEARLVPKTPKTEKLLFGSKSLSINTLRKLEGKTCDRAIFWQPYCEKWLREHQIFPNTNLEYFHGLPQDKGKYHRSTGLPLPSTQEQKQRESALKQWQRARHF